MQKTFFICLVVKQFVPTFDERKITVLGTRLLDITLQGDVFTAIEMIEIASHFCKHAECLERDQQFCAGQNGA